jgi:GT2 family glycosyltransferase
MSSDKPSAGTDTRHSDFDETLSTKDSQMADLEGLLQEKDTHIANLEKLLQDKDAHIASQRETLNAVLNSKGWRLLDRYRRLKQRVTGRLSGTKKPEGISFEGWFRETQRLMPSGEHFVEQVARFDYRPLISIIMPVYNTPESSLRGAIESVLGQYYPHWELCICDDGSSSADVRKVLDEYTNKDSRIRLARAEANLGIAGASNRALELARGEFIALLDHDDQLAPEALFEVARLLQTDRGADLIYSDEDKLDEEGRHTWPFFKPDWSPDLLLSRMYTCHLGVYRKALVDRLGGFRSGFDGCQDYDLVLRFTELTDNIRHIPRVLYSWRMGSSSSAADPTTKPETHEVGRRVLEEALGRRGIEAEVLDGFQANVFRVRRNLTAHPLVSIIIPTRDRLDLLSKCIRSLEHKTTYPNYEIVIVDHESSDPKTLRFFRECGHRVIRCEGPFNFPRLNNSAARVARGTHLLFLNNDTEVQNRDWLEAMMEHGLRQDVGAVGAKLFYPDGRIQHAGVVLGVGGVANHAYRFVRGKGYFGFIDTIRNYSAVTAACALIRKDVFEEVGGFDEALPANFNDVDLCLKIRQAGYLIVYTPYAVLTHYESASREAQVEFWEGDLISQRWASLLENDPYYNENLSLTAVDFRPGSPRPYNVRTDVYQYVSGTPLGELTAGRSVGQTFVSRRDQLTALSIRFGTYGRRGSGRLRFVLREGRPSGEEVVRTEFAMDDLVDNQSRLFWFPPLGNSKGKTFYFSIESLEGEAGSSVAVWANPRSVPSIGSCYRDGRVMDHCLSFATYALKDW